MLQISINYKKKLPENRGMLRKRKSGGANSNSTVSPNKYWRRNLLKRVKRQGFRKRQSK